MVAVHPFTYLGQAVAVLSQQVIRFEPCRDEVPMSTWADQLVNRQAVPLGDVPQDVLPSRPRRYVSHRVGLGH